MTEPVGHQARDNIRRTVTHIPTGYVCKTQAVPAPKDPVAAAPGPLFVWEGKWVALANLAPLRPPVTQRPSSRAGLSAIAFVQFSNSSTSLQGFQVLCQNTLFSMHFCLRKKY